MNAMIKRFFCCAVALSGIAMLGAVNYTPVCIGYVGIKGSWEFGRSSCTQDAEVGW
jgi:hypothetical protein